MRTKKNPEISLNTALRRKENRYNYVMPIKIRTKAIRCEGETINVSYKGIKFSAQPKSDDTSVSIGDFVYVIIPELNEYLDSFLADDDQKITPEFFMYQVVYLEALADKVIVACEYVGQSFSDLLMLESYIEERLQACEIDKSHEIDNIKYTFYEYLRFDYITELVYYFIPHNKSGLFIESEKNRFIFGHATNSKSNQPDFSPFLTPSCIDYICNQLNDKNDFYLYLFWDNNSLYFKYSFEIKSKKELLQLQQQVVHFKGYVLKAYTSKISLSQTKDEVELDQKINSAKNIIHQIVMFDITKFVIQCSHSLFGLDKTSPSTFPEIKRKHEQPYTHKCFSLNSHNQRMENRYLLKTEVRISHNRDNYISAHTVDFSYSGLAVMLANIDNKPDLFSIDKKIWVDFIALNTQMKKVELSCIPFIIKNIINCQSSDKVQFGLLRDTENCPPNINQFFDNVIERNRLKLPLCQQDKINLISKQHIQTRYKETLQTIPIFLSETADGEFIIKEIKVYNEKSDLAEFFKVGNKYSFACLTRELLLKKFSQYISMKHYQAKPFLAFFIKVNDDIKVITNEEITDKKKLYKIALDTIHKNGKCILLYFNENKNFDEQTFIFAFNKHSHPEPKEIEYAKKQVTDIRGYMELIDITSYFIDFLD
ncbi:MAG: PilZ domain-containing protein [Gammaproteobacteria bacterium]|nr:PilZ domain-containing protein [Gammaproteobacteria bacterium]